jgi:hypothetical protein
LPAQRLSGFSFPMRSDYAMITTLPFIQMQRKSAMSIDDDCDTQIDEGVPTLFFYADDD